MELRHLRVFAELAEELHFGRTAAKLRVAQSAVSQTLRDLEDEVGLRLVERSSRQVKLTAAGRAFLAHARESVRAAATGVHAARDAERGERRIRLRVLAAAMPARVSRALAELAHAEPATVLELRDGSSSQNLAALEDARCDVALVSLASRRRIGPELAHTQVATSPLVLVVSTQHPLASRRRVPLTALRGERVLQPDVEDEPAVRDALGARLATIGVAPPTVSVSSPAVLLSLVAAGLGVAVLPAFVAEEAKDVRRVPLALDGKPEGGLLAVWRRAAEDDRIRALVARLAEAAPASRRRER